MVEPTESESQHELDRFCDAMLPLALSLALDLHPLSPGDIVFAGMTGWRKIDQDRKVLFAFKAPKGEIASRKTV